MEPKATTDAVLDEVLAERARQDAKWGEQNHKDGTDADPWKLMREVARRHCDERAALGIVTWLDILREEVFEAFAESDPAKLREEMIQVAAVAVNWVEAIDRRLEKEKALNDVLTANGVGVQR